MGMHVDTARFAADGFLVVRDALTSAEVEALRTDALAVKAAAIGRRLAGLRYWPSRIKALSEQTAIPRDEVAACTWGVNEITRRELLRPGLVNVLGHPTTHRVTLALLGENPRAWGLKLLWAPQIVDYDLHWHRDTIPLELYDACHHKPAAQDHIQYNAALYDDPSFIVVPGSHRRALTDEEWRAIRYDPAAELPGQARADLSPGDVLFMDAHTLHRGACAAGSPRLTLHFSAQASWVPLKRWGTTEDQVWITGDEFMDQLTPVAREYYQALRTTNVTDDAVVHVRQAAVASGWSPRSPRPT